MINDEPIEQTIVWYCLFFRQLQ